MAGNVADYIDQKTADYTATQFDVTPQGVLWEDGDYDQEEIKYDGGNIQVITKGGGTPEFFFRLAWSLLREADADKIVDFFFDSAKAKGRARSFEFPHPTDGNTYIVRFASSVSRSIRLHRGFKEITLRVVGYK
jgi:hypothetical protein